MLVRRNNQRVWVFSELDAERNRRQIAALALRHPQAANTPGRVLNATRPIDGKVGRCLAIRLRGSQLEVLVAHPHRFTGWYPANEALTERQAEAWAAFGFGR